MGATAAITIPWLFGATVGEAAVVGAGAALGAASISSSNKQNKQAKSAAAEQANRQAALEKQYTDKTAAAADQANNTATRDAARNRQKQLALGAQGRNSTILTSPLGVQSTPQGGLKTLLGS